MRAQSNFKPNGAPHRQGDGGDGGELSVVVGCHGFVCAFGVQWVTRLVLPDEVTPWEADPDTRLVSVAGEAYAAWDLGALFGLGLLASAWVLLGIPYEGGRLPIALRTGPCIVVKKVRAEMSLPVLAFRARGKAFLGAFDASALIAEKLAVGAFGVVIDPTALLDRPELAASASSISKAASNREAR